MKKIQLRRREFLAASAASFCVNSLRSAAMAIEPLNRTEPYFKFSLAAYSYRKLLKRASPKFSLFDFVDDCASFGLQGTELTSYYFPLEITDDYLRRLKRHCFRLGLGVSGTAVRNDFGRAPGPERDREIAHVKRWVNYAEILGAPVIRIFAGHAHEGHSSTRTHELIVDGIRECCQYAGQYGVHLALENHGGPTATASGLLGFVKDVDSPWFGVNLDTGNFHSADIYGDLARVAPYAINVQVKVVMAGPDQVKHPVNYARLAQLLKVANYRGYVALEYEESGNPRLECRNALRDLRAAFS
ncbi:MAG: sugar phosphate isomerase/epimerase [Pirellulaceae bacterium]|nr:sugar phosphate isomerase/epimerase [Pirellulaceae bacterium]